MQQHKPHLQPKEASFGGDLGRKDTASAELRANLYCWSKAWPQAQVCHDVSRITMANRALFTQVAAMDQPPRPKAPEKCNEEIGNYFHQNICFIITTSM